MQQKSIGKASESRWPDPDRCLRCVRWSSSSENMAAAADQNEEARGRPSIRHPLRFRPSGRKVTAEAERADRLVGGRSAFLE